MEADAPALTSEGVLPGPGHLVHGLVQQQEGGREVALVDEQGHPGVQAAPQGCVGQQPGAVPRMRAAVHRAQAPVQRLRRHQRILHAIVNYGQSRTMLYGSCALEASPACALLSTELRRLCISLLCAAATISSHDCQCLKMPRSDALRKVPACTLPLPSSGAGAALAPASAHPAPTHNLWSKRAVEEGRSLICFTVLTFSIGDLILCCEGYAVNLNGVLRCHVRCLQSFQHLRVF